MKGKINPSSASSLLVRVTVFMTMDVRYIQKLFGHSSITTTRAVRDCNRAAAVVEVVGFESL